MQTLSFLSGSLVLASLFGASACGGIAILSTEDGSGGDDIASSGVVVGTGGASHTGGAGGDDCGFEPCVIAEGFLGTDIALSAQRLYISTGDAGSIVRLPVRGGALETVSSGDAYAGSLALFDGAVFWAGEKSLFRAPQDGGVATILATPGVPLGAVAIDGDSLYFVDWQTFGSIRAVPNIGGETRVVVPYASLANDLGFQRGIKNWDELFWVSSDQGHGELHALLLDGASEPTTLLGGMETPGLVLHAFEGTYVSETYAGNISRVGPSGTGEFLVGTVNLPSGLAIDDSFLYITEAGDPDANDGRILRIGRFEATGIEVVAENLHSPRGIVADGEAIYWLESDPKRAVMRLSKPAF